MPQVIGELTGGIFTSEMMNYTLKICPVCGKEFKCYSYDGWAFYRRVVKDGRYVKELLCSYHCMSHTGLLHEKKYDDVKARVAMQVSEKKYKDKYHETRAAYRRKHREEINARQNTRYTAGTQEAEVRRLERNWKQRERKKQKDVEKWKAVML